MSRQTFATQSDVADIQHSLNQLNHNMGRLVTLVDQQIKFFSTMQARGWGPPRSERRQEPAGSSNVDPATPHRLRRRVARDPKPTELPANRNPVKVSLAVRALRFGASTRLIYLASAGSDPTGYSQVDAS